MALVTEVALLSNQAVLNALGLRAKMTVTHPNDPDEREAFVADQRAVYEADVDLLRLASENVIDAVVAIGDLRHEVAQRLWRAVGKNREFSDRRHGVPPV